MTASGDTNKPGTHVKRGCLSAEIEARCTSPKCEKCVGLLCNNIKIPSDRSSCLNCANATDCAQGSQSSLCPILAPTSAKESCYTKFDSGL